MKFCYVDRVYNKSLILFFRMLIYVFDKDVFLIKDYGFFIGFWVWINYFYEEWVKFFLNLNWFFLGNFLDWR